MELQILLICDSEKVKLSFTNFSLKYDAVNENMLLYLLAFDLVCSCSAFFTNHFGNDTVETHPHPHRNRYQPPAVNCMHPNSHALINTQK